MSSIPNDFYKEEVISEHHVTAQTKKLWAVELGCLAELQRICEKHHIKYFACGGTLLGAVRHKGFIPWDDDIDVMMFYEDYVRFCEIAPKEISKPFFLQNYQTEPGFGPAMSRIRNCETTGCTQYDFNMADRKYNCGVFIDIFPLFGIESGSKLFKQKCSIKIWKNVLAGSEIKRMARQGGWKWNLKKWLHPRVWLWNIVSIFINHKKVSKKYLHACASANSYSKMGLLSFTAFKTKFIWDKEWFSELINMPFEYTYITCPKNYDPILQTQYGDYMKFVKGGQIHTMVLCDPDTPFQEKLKKLIKE